MGPFPSALASETPVPREPVALHQHFVITGLKFRVYGLKDLIRA